MNYPAIDYAKLFLAILIVSLHTWVNYIPETIYNIFAEKVFIRLAVPFFFVVSGFFIGKKLDKGEPTSVILGYCKRLLYPLIFISFINYSLYFVDGLIHQVAIGQLITEVVRHIFFYPRGALWFVQACIIGALILIPFLYNNRLLIGFVFGIGLYITASLLNTYYFILIGTPLQRMADTYLEICISGRNGLFLRFFYLLLGVITYKYGMKVKHHWGGGYSLSLFYS